MNTRPEREKRRERKRGDVLYVMSVTLFVSHLERSPLNTETPQNAIKRDIKRRVHKKGKNDKYKYLTRSEYIIIQNMFMNTRTEREKEREGRTFSHVGDTGYIPLGDIFIKGTLVFEHIPHTQNI